MRLLRVTLLALWMFIFTSLVLAQQPRPVDHLLSGALSATMLADEVTSYQVFQRCPTCKEVGLPTAARVPLKVGVFTFILVAEHKWPEHRTAFRVFKVGMGALYGWAAWHNHGVGRH